MSFNYSPKIITDGLVLYLDAGNIRSYPTIGTIWNDLSKSGFNGSLVNGPVFNSNNGGSIMFDGVNDVMTTTCTIQAATSSNLQTFCSWLKGTTTNNSFFGSDASSTGQFHLILDYPTPTELRFAGSFYGGGGVSDQNNIVTVTPYLTWNYGCIVKTSVSTFDVYFNGIKVISNANKTANASSSLNLGRWWNTQYTPSNIATVSVYNRALTSTEVLQNYNTTKSRFGL